MQNSPSEKWRAKTGASFWQFQAKRGADLLFDSYLFVQFAIAFYFATGPVFCACSYSETTCAFSLLTLERISRIFSR